MPSAPSPSPQNILSLLPRIFPLLNIPSESSALIIHVLPALRNAARASPTLFPAVAPLLAHLFSTLLNPELHLLHSHASRTCIAFLRCLIDRRKAVVATAFLDDVARALAVVTKPDAMHTVVLLRNFSQVASQNDEGFVEVIECQYDLSHVHVLLSFASDLLRASGCSEDAVEIWENVEVGCYERLVHMGMNVAEMSCFGAEAVDFLKAVAEGVFLGPHEKLKLELIVDRWAERKNGEDSDSKETRKRRRKCERDDKRSSDTKTCLTSFLYANDVDRLEDPESKSEILTRRTIIEHLQDGDETPADSVEHCGMAQRVFKHTQKLKTAEASLSQMAFPCSLPCLLLYLRCAAVIVEDAHYSGGKSGSMGNEMHAKVQHGAEIVRLLSYALSSEILRKVPTNSLARRAVLLATALLHHSAPFCFHGLSTLAESCLNCIYSTIVDRDSCLSALACVAGYAIACCSYTEGSGRGERVITSLLKSKVREAEDVIDVIVKNIESLSAGVSCRLRESGCALGYLLRIPSLPATEESIEYMCFHSTDTLEGLKYIGQALDIEESIKKRNKEDHYWVLLVAAVTRTVRRMIKNSSVGCCFPELQLSTSGDKLFKKSRKLTISSNSNEGIHFIQCLEFFAKVVSQDLQEVAVLATAALILVYVDDSVCGKQSNDGGVGDAHASLSAASAACGLELQKFLSMKLDGLLMLLHSRILEDENLFTGLRILLGCSDEILLWMRVAKIALPRLVDQGNLRMLDHLARRAKRPAKLLIEGASVDIIVKSALKDASTLGDKTPNRGLTFLCEALGEDAKMLIQSRLGKITQKLATEFGGKDETTAKMALDSIAESTERPTDGRSLMQKHFMLVMEVVNRGLFPSWISPRARAAMFITLDSILRYMGRKVKDFVPKVMESLKLALSLTVENGEDTSKVLRVWSTFLLGLEADIGHHLSTAVAVLVPVLEDFSEIIAPVILEIVTRHGASFGRQHLEKLSFLIETVAHPSLSKVTHAIAHLLSGNSPDGRSHTASGGSGKPSSINFIHRNINDELLSMVMNHKSPGIRASALERIHKFLLQQRTGELRNVQELVLRGHGGTEIQEARKDGVFRDDSAADKSRLNALTRLVCTLIECLTDSCAICREKAAQCLGEIGALDPSRLMLIPRNQHNLNILCVSTPSNGQWAPSETSGWLPKVLAGEIIEGYLVPALRQGDPSPKSHRQNRVGFIIQELLKLCDCTTSTPESARQLSIRQVSATKSSRSVPTPPKAVEVIVNREAGPGELAAYFWARLDPETQLMITPYLAAPSTSANAPAFVDKSFLLVNAGSIWDNTNDVIEWVENLTCQIATLVEQASFLGRVLASLRPLLKREHNIAVPMLPFLIREAVDWESRRKKGSLNAQRDLSSPAVGTEDISSTGNSLSQTSSDVLKFLVGEVSTAIKESHDAAHMLFSVLDKLTIWRDQRVSARLASARRKHQRAVAVAKKKKQRKLLLRLSRNRPVFYSFLAQDPLTPFVDLNGRGEFSLQLLAQAALQSHAYQRALLYLEQHTRLRRNGNGNGSWPSNLGLLLDKSDEACELRMFQRIYAELEDADSFTGVAAIRRETSLSEMVIDAEASEKYRDALLCYEKALGSNPRDPSLHAGFLKCLRTLGHWEAMLDHADALVASSNVSEKKLRGIAGALGIEAAWRLGRWDRVEHLTLNDELAKCCTTWEPKYGHALGKMLLSLKRGDSSVLAAAARSARRAVLEGVAATSREGYSRIYPFLARLHTVCDIEDCIIPETRGSLLTSMKHRADLVSQSLRVREPILSARRVCVELLGRETSAIDISLELSRCSRKGRNLRAAVASAYRAHSAMSGNAKHVPDVALEIARIMYEHGDTTTALLTVSKEIEQLKKLSKDDFRLKLAAAHLLAGQWKEESRGAPSSVILSHYQRAAALDEKAEAAFYALGRHYDMLLRASPVATNSMDLEALSRSPHVPSPDKGMARSRHEYTPLIIKNFAIALRLGHSKIFEALPRMLTIWMEFYSELEKMQCRTTMSKVEGRVHKEAQTAFRNVPMYMWMTVMPQMLSRILHPSLVVRDWLSKVIAGCVAYYPDQCVWLVAPSTQLKCPERRSAVKVAVNKGCSWFKQCQRRTLTEAKELNSRVSELIRIGLSVIRELIAIASNVVKKVNTGVQEAGPEFNRLRHLFPSHIMVPTLQSLTVILPQGQTISYGESSSQHNYPFGENVVCIEKLESKVMVMSSAMRPRRIGFIGTDGETYRFLAKKEEQGDMRRDSRLIEFITVVNRLLAKDRECQIRNLSLKTYGVLPMTEQTGMIEWMSALKTMREIVRIEHTKIGIPYSSAEIGKIYDKYADKVAWLAEWAIPKFPAVLHRFFLMQFGSDPLSWYNARLRWTRSVALWSMTGYIVGLGDRHCENVLVETMKGTCVHVDFAMLFEKGKTLQVPEIVPFRLTQNMVDAMGIHGYEGCFRIVAERSLYVLRNNSDALMGVLESFLHDPMTDWKKISSQRHKSAEVYAQETRTAVEQKLKGTVGAGLPLSVQGQIEQLIREATSSHNLGKMYVWWSPWI